MRISGGPCAGKSSGMTLLSERLKALGFEVFIITEIATMYLNTCANTCIRVFTGGAHIYDGMDISERFALESGIMKMQMTLEDVYNNIAKASGKPTVLLCDRGVLDTRGIVVVGNVYIDMYILAYMDPTAYDSMMEANGWYGIAIYCNWLGMWANCVMPAMIVSFTWYISTTCI